MPQSKGELRPGPSAGFARLPPKIRAPQLQSDKMLKATGEDVVVSRHRHRGPTQARGADGRRKPRSRTRSRSPQRGPATVWPSGLDKGRCKWLPIGRPKFGGILASFS